MLGRRFTALVLIAATALLPGLAHANLAALVGPRTEQAQANTMTTITSTYDDNGNLETRSDGTNTDTHSYDAENRLVASEIQLGPDPESITYTYDADGLRTSRTDGSATTEYLTDKNREFGEVLAETTGATVVTYTHGHHRIHQSAPGTERFYVYDGGLSTRQLADASGAVTDKYTYDAFGILSARTGTTPNAYLYRGEHLDSSSGFYYLRARYYAPEVGRFVTTDPVAGSMFEPLSLHRYLYAHANPVDNRDPSGTTSLLGTVLALSLRAIQIGIFVGLAAGLKTTFLDGGTDEDALRSMVSGFIMGFAFGFAISASATYHGTLLFSRLFVSSGRLIRIPFSMIVSIHRFVSTRLALSLSAGEALAYAAYPITSIASFIGGAIVADQVDTRLVNLLEARHRAEYERKWESSKVTETIRRGPRGESVISALQEGVDIGITFADDDGLVREFESLQRDIQ